MEKITSISNNKIQFIKKLSDKKNRQESGLFVVEGENILKDLPKYIEIEALVVVEEKKEYFAEICCKCMDKLIVVNQKIMSSIGETVSPSGILAVIKIPQNKFSQQGNCLVLDGISDPGNFGTLIRTCVACGIVDVFAINCVDWTSPKVVRSSMGGIFRVNIFCTNYDEIEQLLHNYTILALDMAGENIFEYKYDKEKSFALTVGNESNGLSLQMRKMCNKLISLPMLGDIESLNAAVSASVGMYQLVFGKKE